MERLFKYAQSNYVCLFIQQKSLAAALLTVIFVLIWLTSGDAGAMRASRVFREQA